MSFTGSLEGKSKLKQTDVIRYLVKMINDINPSVARDAATSLINLSEDADMLRTMIQYNAIVRTADSILEGGPLVELLVIFLSNLTRDEEGARQLLQVGNPLMGYYITKLIGCFLRELSQNDPTTLLNKKEGDEKREHFAWIASILTNITKIKEGRQYILDKSKGLLLALLSHINNKNVIRKRGLLGMIRNCLFEFDYHEWLLSEEVDILTHLLLPLRGSDVFSDKESEGMSPKLRNVPPNKTRESDRECRRMIIDCLTLLTATRNGRETMRAKKVYPILREYDKVEGDETISCAIYNLVRVLILDEAPEQSSNSNEISEIISLKPQGAPPIEHHSSKSEPYTFDYSPVTTSNISNTSYNFDECQQITISSKVDLDEEGEPIEEI